MNPTTALVKCSFSAIFLVSTEKVQNPHCADKQIRTYIANLYLDDLYNKFLQETRLNQLSQLFNTPIFHTIFVKFREDCKFLVIFTGNFLALSGVKVTTSKCSTFPSFVSSKFY